MLAFSRFGNLMNTSEKFNKSPIHILYDFNILHIALLLCNFKFQHISLSYVSDYRLKTLNSLPPHK